MSPIQHYITFISPCFHQNEITLWYQWNQVVYITVLFPYFVLIIFFVRALTLKVTIWYFTMISAFIELRVSHYQVLGSILIFLFVEALVVKVNQAIIGHLFLRELFLIVLLKRIFWSCQRSWQCSQLHLHHFSKPDELKIIMIFK